MTIRMTLEIQYVTIKRELQYPMMLKQMTDEETKEYHLKKFAEWGKKWEQECKGELVFGVDGNIYRNGKLLAEKPNYEQKAWVLRKLKKPNSWRRCR